MAPAAKRVIPAIPIGPEAATTEAAAPVTATLEAATAVAAMPAVVAAPPAIYPS